MLKNIYILLWILFQSFVEINCQIIHSRFYHTTTLIDNKLYILGGTPPNFVGTEFLYLDVSAPFNTQNLPWKNLSSVNIVPSHFGAASVNGGADNNTLILYGGSTNTTTAALVYTFDPQSNSWSAPIISGVSVTRKYDLTGIIDNNKKMYLWGGYNGTNSQNSMFILDTINLSWREGSLVGPPTPRFNYGATLLPNQTIIYIGE